MTSQHLRRRFLNYFKEHGHALVPSSPVVPADDPTLLFTNAGMNQFKDVFLGKSVRDYTCATSSQKCIRVGGKHNDLENVGHTTRHLTFFEMLGNFSFGDYFKQEAIAHAWHVVTHIFEFPPENIWATVFHEDEESFALWTRFLPETRIVRLGEKDNFWAMGDTGPCGPCSELLYDRGSLFGPARSPAEDVTGERFLEFWNLVFMQYNKTPTQELLPLPKKCVDTGAGLERLISLKMGVNSLFETDILRALIGQVEHLSRVVYTPDSPSAPAFRVIADHVRALAFAIADGVIPSNLDRGYVLRKILRRAVRYGRSLGFEKPFLAHVFPRLLETMGADFPELERAQEVIVDVLNEEEEGFLRTLKRGGTILNTIMQHAQTTGKIDGEEAFKLKDTYGLPLEEILLLAKDAKLSVDTDRFETLEQEAKHRSRVARKTTDQTASASLYEEFLHTHGPTTFVGYQNHVAQSTLVGLVKHGQFVSSLQEGDEGGILVHTTPFYAEKGGQVADRGTIQGPAGVFAVLDCQSPFADLILHQGVVREGTLNLGEVVHLEVEGERRAETARNHTATHLLHWALCHVLGPHIKQAGSLVEPERLRFDFHHNKPLSQEQIEQIEDLVNAHIRANLPVHTYEMPYVEAVGRTDIKQFFSDKYGTHVRVVDIAPSKELCGGTHTAATGDIGTCRIVKESSIAAGIRRLEAVTGAQAEQLARTCAHTLDALATLLKVPTAQLLPRIHQLLEEMRQQNHTLAQHQKTLLAHTVDRLIPSLETHGHLQALVAHLEADPEQLRRCAEILAARYPQHFALLLVGTGPEKGYLYVRVSDDLVARGIHAHAWLRAIAPLLGGKGGGKADCAQGGITRWDTLETALTQARLWIAQQNY